MESLPNLDRYIEGAYGPFTGSNPYSPECIGDKCEEEHVYPCALAPDDGFDDEDYERMIDEHDYL